MKKHLLFLFSLILIGFIKLNAQVNGPVVFCSNTTQNYQRAFSSGYSWSIAPVGPTIITPSAQTTDIILGPLSQYTITVVTSAPTNTFTIIIDNNTPAAPSTSGATICDGNVAMPTATGIGTFNWYTASTGGVSFNTGGAYTTAALSSTTTYYVSATNAGCTSLTRSPVTVNVNPLPNVSV